MRLYGEIIEGLLCSDKSSDEESSKNDFTNSEEEESSEYKVEDVLENVAKKAPTKYTRKPPRSFARVERSTNKPRL